MANEGNLKPQNKRTKSEQRAIAQKGGIASGKARAKKKSLKETLQALLELEYDMDGTMLKGNEATSVALIKQALNGNVKAYEVIRDTIGEKPVSGVSLENGDESKEIRISFVDKTAKSGTERDPKIVGEYTPPRGEP